MPKPINIPKIYKQWYKYYGTRTAALYNTYRAQCFVAYFFETILDKSHSGREAFGREELSELCAQAYDYAAEQFN
jgi:hypothetical protein